MEEQEQNLQQKSDSKNYLEEQIFNLKLSLSYALNIPIQDIKVNFPTLKNFYLSNNIYKSSWAIYIKKEDENTPKLLFTGNYIIQGGCYSKRAIKSPFGAQALSSLTSIANTYSTQASIFKQNWTMDLNLLQSNDEEKLNFSLKEYKDFLTLLNNLRAQWLLHLSEEGKFDLVICEYSEPTDPLFFVDLESIDSSATKIKTYFKPISSNALELLKQLAINTEFEGKFLNLQPGTWVKDEVLVELESLYPARFFSDEEIEVKRKDTLMTNLSPFKVHSFKPSY